MLDLGDIEDTDYQFLRPLCSGWLSKIEMALTSQPRKKWKEVADECMMFYSKSAAAMWDPLYSKKFWRGVKAPRFRVTINKAFEFVAVFGPNLLWDVPHRTVTPKKILELPQDAFPDPQMYQVVMQMAAQEASKDKVVAQLLTGWLNYTPREMPGNGLEGHNELAVLDAMLTGMGCMWPAPYSMPGSERTLTGCFRKPPGDLIIDPDFKTMQEAKWIALRHTEAHWQVERRFKLPPGSLKNKATLESSWHYAELASSSGDGGADRKAGKTSDLIVWYEVWSKLGTGARMTGMPSIIKNQLEETVGDYAYLAICPDCPYPLNCPADKIRNGATSEEVRQSFEWPVPLWTDDRWPVEVLRFYDDPESAYPIAPLAPALGELKAMNAIVSWLVNRTWQSSRQMYAVLGQYYDDIKKVLDDGADLDVFALPPGSVDDVKKMIQIIENKEVNRDSWQVLDILSNNFDKRMGMTPFVYGQNEDGTQDRTASTTEARKSAVSARPEYMQKKVVGWQSRVAGVEAMLTWLFVKAPDVVPLLGQAGAMLWKEHIENADAESVMRQMHYEVAASSVRRPNRDRDIADLNELMGRFLPEASKRAELTGDWEPINGLLKKYGELHDMDLDGLFFQPKDENSPEAQLQTQMQQAELQKVQAEAVKLQSEAQANPAALKQQELQMKGAMDQQKMQMDQQQSQQEMAMELKKMEAELQMKMVEMQLKIQEKKMEMQMAQQEHQQNIQMQQEQGQVDMAVKTAEGAQKIQMGQQQMAMQREQGATQVAVAKAQAKTKIDTTKEQSKAKVDTAKKMAATKPKPGKAA